MAINVFLHVKHDKIWSGAYIDLLLGEGNQIFSLIQAQNLQVKLLVIFRLG
jgi:hypothetical protein